MPRAERGTPKDIANRMKAKGLQKLRFYCQMCDKQCRDANGFKCHITSDSHLRQMKLFSENSGRIMDGFSREFEKTYMDILRRRHGTTRMNANNVYQEVIQDKGHIHMNATKWSCLGGFVRYLGKVGKCKVEETERGWYITYIERDPELLARREAQEKRVEAERLEEIKQAIRIEKQRVEAAKLFDGNISQSQPSNIIQNGQGNPVSISLNTASKKTSNAPRTKVPVFQMSSDEEKEDHQELNPSTKILLTHNLNINKTNKRIHPNPQVTIKKQKKEDDKKPKKEKRTKHWLEEGILVRIITRKLAGGRYYKRKAVVNSLLDKFTAQIETLDTVRDRGDGGDVIRIDQDALETVVPKIGKNVKILNGEGRGHVAELVSTEKKECKAVLKLRSGDVLEKAYDDFSKVA